MNAKIIAKTDEVVIFRPGIEFADLMPAQRRRVVDTHSALTKRVSRLAMGTDDDKLLDAARHLVRVEDYIVGDALLSRRVPARMWNSTVRNLRKGGLPQSP